ncbi:MAG: proton-conducting transporter transmembrane domain-containing protein, partial [Vulcanimicrobiaceae bacterium]
SCALYAMMRTLAVGSILGASPLLDNLLMWFGAISTVLAGMAILTQRDLKRLLAYSTVEHAGIVALALGFGGPLGFLAALIHAIAHAFTKSAAFFAAGMVQREHHTTELGKLRGLWKTGRSGRFLLATLTALAGMPPFGLFVGELLLVLAGIAAHRWAPLMVGFVGIALAFAALSRTAIEIESGQAKRSGGRVLLPRSRLAFLATSFALAAALSIAVVPWTPLAAALRATASAIGGTR